MKLPYAVVFLSVFVAYPGITFCSYSLLQMCVKNYAEQVLTKTAWAYYRSTGDDEYTYWENFESFKRFWFRPRV